MMLRRRDIGGMVEEKDRKRFDGEEQCEGHTTTKAKPRFYVLVTEPARTVRWGAKSKAPGLRRRHPMCAACEHMLKLRVTRESVTH